MHFLIGLIILIALVAFAFGIGTARAFVASLITLAVLAVVGFFGYLAYDIASDLREAKIAEKTAAVETLQRAERLRVAAAEKAMAEQGRRAAARELARNNRTDTKELALEERDYIFALAESKRTNCQLHCMPDYMVLESFMYDKSDDEIAAAVAEAKAQFRADFAKELAAFEATFIPSPNARMRELRSRCLSEDDAACREEAACSKDAVCGKKEDAAVSSGASLKARDAQKKVE